MQDGLDRLDGGRQALEGGQQRVAQAALDSDLVVSTAVGHDRLSLMMLSRSSGRTNRLVALSILAPGGLNGPHPMEVNQRGRGFTARRPASPCDRQPPR